MRISDKLGWAFVVAMFVLIGVGITAPTNKVTTEGEGFSTDGNKLCFNLDKIHFLCAYVCSQMQAKPMTTVQVDLVEYTIQCMCKKEKK